MPISWNEIRHNAIKFSGEWKGATSESAEKQTFWNEFFQVFGIKRRVVASFEEPAKRISGTYGFIDLLWRGVLLVEHKSFGEDLGKAKAQAFNYIQDLANEGRHAEIPRYIIVSDFARVALHDLEPEEQRDLPLFDKRRGTTIEFPLTDFHKYIHAFAFIPGYKQHTYKEEDPINIEAAETLGNLHDTLEAGGYAGHDLERFLVRILFCLFAEDTGIFERESFHLFLENRTAPDGSDLGQCLAHLFEILNTPLEKRQKNLDETLAAFPYVNGDLFCEHLGFASFNRDMRNALLGCCEKDWSRISPAIFGSLFQSIMQPKERRQIGAHYTSERDILKVARSLFLDDLRAEFEVRKADRSTGRKARLEELHKKICDLRFLDPACGCGNFLVITYRELRQLELETLEELLTVESKGQRRLQRELTLDEVNRLSQVDVDQFYGIEIEEWPARIAEVALWLMDHQMNQKISAAFGQLYQRLPLKKSPAIRCGNALRIDWQKILPSSQCSYVLGNPPFVGKSMMNAEQKSDMEVVCGKVKGAGVLDFVTGWYFKAAEYIKGTNIRVGFVSTNSISQGEQPGILWGELFAHHHLKIHFAHRPFQWESEARGKAHVHVVIVGFGAFETTSKKIYDYERDKVSVTIAKNINPYLVEGNDVCVKKRTNALCESQPMVYGSKPVDGGHLMLTPEERSSLLKNHPESAPFIRPILGSEELINGGERYCLWLLDAEPKIWRNIPEIYQRVEAVRTFRLQSTKEKTKEQAATPAIYSELRQPDSDYLAVPEVSSETRAYIPIGYLSKTIIASNLLYTVPNASRYTFGIIISQMHMAWMRLVAGRLESRYRYSAGLVYNNFPWPSPTPEQRERVEEKARAVLAAREPHLPPRGLGTLADLYDPLSMPPALAKAHAELDRAVEKCYRPEPFDSDRQRVEFLFALYEKLTAPLLPVTPKTKSRRSQSITVIANPRKQRTPGLTDQTSV
jgi:hypothetical protein